MSTRPHGARLWLWCLPFFALAAPASALGQGRTATINGESLYYEVAGTGTPLVLIHGWSLNLAMWDPQVSALSRRFRVIRYDRRGFGKSSGSEDVSWDAADLNALLDHLAATKAHLLGMSQGGRVALQFARRYPDRVLSLMLHGTPPPEGFGLPWSGADRTRFDDWTTIAREQGLDAFRRTWAAHPLMEIPAARPGARARLAELLAGYRGGRFFNPTPPSGPLGAVTMDDLSRISVPTLVLVGESEVPFLRIVARALAYYVPTARLAVVPGGGHMVNLIEPDRYNATILEFLTGVDRQLE
ncbi:MAG: alpha/beta fold hydrolase [Gemmatimonadales bacterium]